MSDRDGRDTVSSTIGRIAGRLAAIPGVEAVTLGGSRAVGTQRAGSDWDFGLYYRGTIDPADVAALGWPGRVSAPGAWGPVVNGRAWLTVEGESVDLCYRNIDEVVDELGRTKTGEFRIESLATYVVGVPTYVLAGELALNRVLIGDLPGRRIPRRCRRPPRRCG